MEDEASKVLSYLLDTDVISQLAKSEPIPGVIPWLDRNKDAAIYLSVITIEEIREGIEMMPVGKKKNRLDRWLSEGLLLEYKDRILPITVEIADRCGRILGSDEVKGFNPDVNDTYIAATALVHGLSVATLNRKHFEKLGVELVEL